MIYPPALQQGDTIGIVATARWIEPDKLTRARKRLEERGFQVKVHPNNGLRLHEWAGGFKDRAEALTEYWQDPGIKAIFTAGGGNRTLHLLDYIDFELLKKTPKVFLGYSDNTALISALNTLCGQVAFHGPDIGRFASDKADTYLDQTLDLLSGQTDRDDLSGSEILKYGSATGTLYGGNLCLLSYLLGTKYAPDLTGKIVVIEDELEELRNIDRMLLHLKRIGGLEKAAGLVIGGFTMTLNGGRTAFPYSVEELVMEHLEGIAIPVIANAPISHGPALCTLPMGAQATLTAGKGTISLTL